MSKLDKHLCIPYPLDQRTYLASYRLASLCSFIIRMQQGYQLCIKRHAAERLETWLLYM
jgi:hypothetical protein